MRTDNKFSVIVTTSPRGEEGSLRKLYLFGRAFF